MTNFWKLECLSCGINCDLLGDKYHRTICRECFDKDESWFKEVNSPLEDFDDMGESEVERLEVNN